MNYEKRFAEIQIRRDELRFSRIALQRQLKENQADDDNLCRQLRDLIAEVKEQNNRHQDDE